MINQQDLLIGEESLLNLLFENNENDDSPKNFILKNIINIKNALYRIYVISWSYGKIMRVLPSE